MSDITLIGEDGSTIVFGQVDTPEITLVEVAAPTIELSGALLGPAGLDGADGAAATVSVGTVSTLTAGSNATVTNSGTTSAAVLNFGVPAGVAGSDGSDGAAATISVGTVTTGAAGSSATITNSGTSSAAVFDFSIPKGDTGETGINTWGSITGTVSDQTDLQTELDAKVPYTGATANIDLNGHELIMSAGASLQVDGEDGGGFYFRDATMSNQWAHILTESPNTIKIEPDMATTLGTAVLDLSGLATAGDHTYTFPDKSGTFAMLDDIAASGGGDMLSSTYDPNAVAADAFSMDNMVETSTRKILTSAERTKLLNTTGVNTGDQTTITGNAGTATKLQTARTINGVSFDGTANITVADSTKVPTTTTVNGHALSANVTVSKADIGLGNVDNTSDATKNSAVATLTNKDLSSATNTFPTFNQNTTGNAATATVLQTARNINGVSFNGSTDITITDDTKVPTTRTVAGHALSANVTIAKGDVGLGNVDNTSDADKPVSTATQSALDGKVDVDTSQVSPIQYYGSNSVYVDYPGAGSTGVNGDPAIADDRNGPTGKIWMFYYTSTTGKLMRVEVPYPGAPASALGTPVDSGITGRVNHFVEYNGEWYVGNINKVYKFTTLTSAPTLLSTVSTVGSNGDQSFVANLCIDRHTNGTWYAWYSTYNGTVVGIRRATASSPSGPWTIGTGMWMVPSDISSSLTWLRIFHVIEDTWGNLWAVAGAGKRWGGAGSPDVDDEATVWMAPVADRTTKPSTAAWQCIIDPPYFEVDMPKGISAFNNAYAPTFLQDGQDWYIYVNTGKYGSERIVELKPGLPLDLGIPIASTQGDYTVTSSYTKVPNSKAFVRDGLFKVEFTAATFLFNSTAQFHTVRPQLIDVATNEVLHEFQIQNGDHPYEQRALPTLGATVRAVGGRTLQVQVRYEVGSGQTAPTLSVLRGARLVIEKKD